MDAQWVIRVRLGRYMDRLNRAGLKFNFLGSVRPETDYFCSRFFFVLFFSILPNFFGATRVNFRWRPFLDLGG